MIANDKVEKTCRYLGTRNLESLNKEAFLGLYKVTERLIISPASLE